MRVCHVKKMPNNHPIERIDDVAYRATVAALEFGRISPNRIVSTESLYFVRWGRKTRYPGHPIDFQFVWSLFIIRTAVPLTTSAVSIVVPPHCKYTHVHNTQSPTVQAGPRTTR